MKVIVSSTLILILSCTLLFAQQSIDLSGINNPDQHQCGVKPPTKAQIKHTLEVIDNANFNRNSGTTQLPIRLHIVTETDGSGGVGLDWVNLCLAQLNNRFYDLSIEWYIADVNYINNSSYYNFEAMTEEEGLCGSNEVNDAVNIFFVNSLAVDGYNVCGFSYYPADMLTSMRMFMRNDCVESATNGTFVHEFGHFFNLFHTHEGTEHGNSDINAEHVARTGTQSNCGSKGDLLCDTNADPAGNINSNCIYIDGDTDIYGNTYNPPVSNLMSYYSKNCGWNFTPQQFARMGNGLAIRETHTSYDIDGASPNVVNDPSGLDIMINTQYQVVLSWSDNASNETGYLIERSTDGITFEPLFLGGVASGVTTYIDSGVLANSMYYYRVKASNDDPDDYSNVASIFSGQLYCIPSHQFDNCTAGGVGVGVQEFDLSTGGSSLMNVTSGCDGPLSIFAGTVSPPSLNTNGTYDFNVVYVNSGGTYIEQNISIWLDVNQDGDFSDSDELLFQSNLTPPANVFFGGDITIPPCANSGITTMRIRTRYLPNGPVEDPCGFYNFGETEDYPVNIVNTVSTDPDINFSENSGVPNDGTICEGDQAILSATGGVSYVWDDNSTSPTRIVTSGGTYTVTVSNALGCSDSESITINGTFNPTATIFISETSGAENNDGLLCAGASAQLVAAGGSTFLWDNNSSQAIRNVSSTGSYAVTVTTSNGCSDNTEVDLVFGTVDAEIAISEFSGDADNDGQLCDGDSALLSASGGVTYSWQDGLTGPNRNVTQSGTYSVTVYDNAGCSDSASVDVNVTSVASTSIEVSETSGANDNDGELCQGDQATLTALGGSSYLWSDNSTESSINVSVAGNYQVTITSASGCTSVQSSNITINSIDQASISINEDSGFNQNDGVLCSGDIATLTAQNGTAFLWNDGSTASSRTVSSAGTYSVVVTNQFGCMSEASIDIVYNNGPNGQVSIAESSGSQSNDGELCSGDSAILTATGGASYSWSTGVNSASITVEQAGDYSVTITGSSGCTSSVIKTVIVNSFSEGGIDIEDNSGLNSNDGRICEGDVVELNAFGGQSYLWQDGTTSPFKVVNEVGEYSVTITNIDGCSNVQTESVTIDATPIANIQLNENSGSTANDGIICFGDNANLQASGGESYVWNDGSNNPFRSLNESGVFSVTVTNANGCTASAESSINVSESVNAEIAVFETSGDQDDDGLLCDGDDVQLFASGGSSYQWDTGSSNPNIVVAESGVYSVVVYNENGCSNTANTSISVENITSDEITIIEDSGLLNDDGILCAGSTAMLSISNGSQYQWSTGSNNNTIEVAESGQYEVQVSTAGGCTYNTSIGIVVNTNPQAEIQIEEMSGVLSNDGDLCAGDNATLIANTGYLYSWEDGSSSIQRSVSETGTYSVSIEDANGCGDQTSINLNVYQSDDLSIEVNEISGEFNNDGILCNGDEATVIVTGGSSLEWSNGSASNALIINQSGNYLVTSTNQYGCESSENQTLTFYETPELVLLSEEDSGVQQNDNKLCEGDTATLTAMSEAEVTWDNDSNDLVREIGSSGLYSAVATNEFGCKAASEVEIEVFANPEVEIEINENSGGAINDGIIDFGDEALLKATGANSYLWDDGSKIDVRFVSDEGDYRVDGSNIEGCEASDMATIMYSTVLSLKEIKISASRNEDEVALNWSLNSDSHIDHYIVEKGTKDHMFDQIGVITSERRDDFSKYDFIDDDIENETGYYYRVKGQTFAGEAIYSDVVFIVVNDLEESVSESFAYPNPVINVITFTLEVKEENSTVALDIASESGQDLWGNYILDDNAAIGQREYFVDLSTLSQGIYFIKLRVGKTAKTHKVIILD